MAEYLEKYIERVADVPAQLQRCFKLIRDLDDRSAKLQADVDEKCRQQLTSVQPRGGKAGQLSKRARLSQEETPLSAEIAAGQAQVLSFAEEKMRIAAQVYDLVDKHIRELDEDLKAFASDAEDERRSAGLGADETACDRLGIDLGLPAAADKAAAASAAAAAAEGGDKPRQKRKYTRRKGVAAEAAAGDGAGTSAAAAAAAEEEAAPQDIVGDASEPRYCWCRGVSYGDMICCDNEECPIEWYHFACVGITEQPKGKWYCPECSGTKQQQQQHQGVQQQQQQGHGHAQGGHQKKAGGTKAKPSNA